jgi:spoIIIJ-associated protein
MARHEYEGRTPAEAAIKACEVLGVTRSALKYEVISETGEGIDRRVRIAVEVDESRRPEPGVQPVERSSGGERPERSDRGGGGDRGGGDRGGGDRGGGDRGGGDRGGERSFGGGGRERGGDRGGRGGGRDRDRGGRGGRGGRDRDRGGRGRDRGFDREPAAREADDGIEALLKLDNFDAAGASSRPEITGEMSDKAKQGKQILNEVLRLMGWTANGHVVQDQPDEIHLDITGPDAKKVIGKKGEPLLSMQFLVNRMVSRDRDRDSDRETDGVVVLDVAGYREKRRSALADLARRLATRAVEEKKVVKLSPMSAHDRRVFHLTLTEMKGVTTRSEGDGLYRRLLIIPAEFSAG